MMKQRMKQVLSWLLSLALTLSLLSSMGSTALAANETSIRMLNGNLVKGSSEWTANGGNYQLSEGTYKLDSDITISNFLIAGAVTLDLNGHGIKLISGAIPIYIYNGMSLTLKDSGNTTHYYTLDSNGLATVSDTDPGNGTSFTGGYITGGQYSTGGAVIIASNTSSFIMEGGTILGNAANTGGCVYMNGGTFTMSGGAILGNTAAQIGGAVYVGAGGTFTLKDNGSIKSNKAPNGGGVFVNASTFSMQGGTIIGNVTSGSGGGVLAQDNCAFTMTGGTITGNTASGDGGGVYINGNFTLNMSGGTITNNAAPYGGGVFLTGSSTLAMSGSAAISSNTASTNGGGVAVAGSTVIMAGSAAISSNSASGNGGGIYNSTGTIAMNTGFTGEISNNTTTGGGGGVCMVGGTFDMNAGSILNNRAMEGAGICNNSATVNMKGGLISNNTSNGYGGGVMISTNATFNMKGGLISKNTSTSNGGGVMNAVDGTFNMTGGGINENVAGETAKGGGICNAGIFTMSAGTVEKNKAGYGAGMFTATDATVSGGTISQNEATAGGGVYINNGGTLSMSAGAITTNTVHSGGGGVYVSGTFYASGSAKVTSNTVEVDANIYADNVCLPKNKVITISDTLANTAALGVRMEEEIGVFTSGLSGKLPNGSTVADLFFDDSGRFIVQQDGTSGEAKLTTLHAHNYTYQASGATITATCSAEGCTLDDGDGNHTATLTIGAPTTGNDATVTVTPAGAITGYTVRYQSKSGTTWGAETTTAPSAAGIHRANVKLGTVTASVSYGNNCITYATNLANGSISGEAGATCGATITPTITPAKGYELDTLTVTPEQGSGVTSVELTADGAGFIMPEANVNVSATFKKTDYAVTIADGITNGTVTASKVTANYQDEVILTVTPAEGCCLGSITTTSGTLVQTAMDPETGVLTYVLTMEDGDAVITAEFNQLAVYTIFYNAGGSPEAVSIKMTDGEQSYAMTGCAKLGDIDCWAIQVSGREGTQSFSYAIREDDGGWNTLSIPVVDDIPNFLNAGSAVAIKGEVNVFAVAFIWGEDPDTDSWYYLVTPNTTSLTVPNPDDTENEIFVGWTYLIPSDTEGEEAELCTAYKFAGSTTMTVSLDRLSQSTIISATWMPKGYNYTVSFDPDNGGGIQSSSVTYGNKVTPPTSPTKEGYEFAGWVLADNAVEMAGDTVVQLSPGTVFDFNINIINNLSLKAKWKHVHAFVCLPLDHSSLGDMLSEYYGYKGELHVQICTEMDDYYIEAHSFVNGKCVCGASILDSKVTLTKYIGDEKIDSSVVKDSVVSVTAPEKQGTMLFSKWQYSTDTTNGQDGTWTDLSTMRSVGFTVHTNVSVRAVYENDRFKLTIQSSKYDDSSIAFRFNYSIPDGFTVVDGGLMIGDNVRMRFWDCVLNLWFLGQQYEPSMRNAVKVFGGYTIAQKMYNYETINEPGFARPVQIPLKTFGKTGTVAMAWQPYTTEGYIKAIGAKHYKVEGYNQAKYPIYAMGYIICKDNSTGRYVGVLTNAIAATLEKPISSDVAKVTIS